MHRITHAGVSFVAISYYSGIRSPAAREAQPVFRKRKNPIPMQPPQPKTLNEIFLHNVRSFQHDPLLTYDQNGVRIEFSTKEFEAAVFALCRFLAAQGLQPGDRVAVLSENRPEWHIADFAIQLSAMISVPIYPTLSPSQMGYVLRHSDCAAIVLSSRKQWETIAPLRSELPNLRCLVSMDEWPEHPSEVMSLKRVIRDTQTTEPEREAIRRQARSVDPQSVATIVYTSGTTGVPKGVMLTHSNITWNLWQGLRRLNFELVSPALSVLPLSHVFERLLCYGYFLMDVPIAYGDPYQLAEHFVRHRPAVMGGVPRMLEKIQETVLAQIATMPAHRRLIARWLLGVGKAHLGNRVRGRRATLSGKLFYPLASALVYRKIRKRLGGRLEGMIVGGARLDPAVEEFFLAAGFRIVQGYGLTETSPVIAMDPPHEVKLGAVGLPLEGLEVGFTAEGEIMTRGPHVMKGYYNDPEATASAFEDGWFLTGDIGRLDEHGYLVITGRKKEILVTSGGKNVFPGAIEEQLCRSNIIQQAFVVGDGRKFLSALIVPDFQKLASTAKSNGIAQSNSQEWLGSQTVVDLFWNEIQKYQEGFSEYEKVKKFSFLEESALADPELFTPTQKLRRSVLEQKYRERIERMYSAQ
jgi:long-chain acyl-CoA synthetase